MIEIADHLVDLGPGAGRAGGEVVFEGAVEALRESDTLTGRHLDDRAEVKPSVRDPNGTLEIRGPIYEQPASGRRRHPAGVRGDHRGRGVRKGFADTGIRGQAGRVAIDQGPSAGRDAATRRPFTACSTDPQGVLPNQRCTSLFSANSEEPVRPATAPGSSPDLAMMAGGQRL